MEVPIEKIRQHAAQNRMTLPQICQKCPYRRTMQQLLGLWDQNLMKENGVKKQEQIIKQLQQRINKLEQEIKEKGE